MTLDSNNNSTNKEYNKKKYITLFGIYNSIKGELIPKLRKEGYPCINYTKFSKVVRLYFEILYRKCIYEGISVPVMDYMGTMTAVKTLCTKYNPTKTKWRTVNGKKETYIVKYDVNKKEGYFYFILWELPKKYNWYKFMTSPKWKRTLYRHVMNGNEYLDKSML